MFNVDGNEMVDISYHKKMASHTTSWWYEPHIDNHRITLCRICHITLRITTHRLRNSWKEYSVRKRTKRKSPEEVQRFDQQVSL